jgi:hypothetical protein
MTSLIVNFGYLGLTVFSFLAATILPVSSEARWPQPGAEDAGNTNIGIGYNRQLRRHRF